MFGVGTSQQHAFRALARACAEAARDNCPEGFRCEIESDFITLDIVLRLTSDGIKGVVTKRLDMKQLREIIELGLPIRCYPFAKDITAARDELMRHTLL